MAEQKFEIKIAGDASSLVKASKDSAEALKDVSKAVTDEAAGLKESAKAADKAFASKSQLKGAIEGLKQQFPELASIGRMSLNPIVLVTASLASAFALFKERVEAARRVLAGFELPDIKEEKIKKVDAATEAFKNFSEAIEKTVAAYNSITAASDRAINQIEKELAAEKKLLESRKKRELADLEGRKGSMPAGQYELEKANIEHRYAQAELTAEQRAGESKLKVKKIERDDLEADVFNKLAAAGKIRIASEESDLVTESRLRAAADAARAGREAAMKRKGDILAFQAGEMGPLEAAKYQLDFFMNYGGQLTSEQAIALENANIERAGYPIQAYEGFLRRMPGRNALRKTRAELSSTATSEAAKAYELGQSIPVEESDLRRQMQIENYALEVNRYSGLVGAQSGVQQREQELEKSVKSLRDSGKGVSDETIAALRELTEANAMMRAQINELRKRISTVERRDGL